MKTLPINKDILKGDFNALRLKYHDNPEILDMILQCECRRKCAQKLHDTLQCEDFIFPSLAVAEMATSDDVALIHARLIPPGSTLLDMTCGLAIDTFHFAAKGIKVTSIELDEHTCRVAIHNQSALGLPDCEIINADSISWLSSSSDRFDYIFIDPARRDSSGRHFNLSECSPDLIANLNLLLSRCGHLIIKTTPMADISALCRQLGSVEKVLVIGTVKECKELLMVCRGNLAKTTEADIPYTVESITIGHPSFSFIPSHHHEGSLIFSGEITPGMLLYEPYPAVMKGGGFAPLSRKFSIPRLHPNTALYISPDQSDALPTEFPGEHFEIEEVIPFSKKAIKEFGKKYPKINVAVRNFPLSAPELVKKLKVTEGGDRRLFGLTGPRGEKLLCITTMAL